MMCTWDIDFEFNRLDTKVTNKLPKNDDLVLEHKSFRNSQFHKQTSLKASIDNKSVSNLRARTLNKQVSIKKVEKEATDDFSATD